MRIICSYFIALLTFSLIVGCTQRDAATIGAMVGRTVATPIGTAAVVLDEAVQSTGEIVRQNPRYDNQLLPHTSAANSNHQPPPYAPAPSYTIQQISNNATATNDQTHYYHAEVLVKTTGPAQIESIEFAEQQDISEFWN